MRTVIALALCALLSTSACTDGGATNGAPQETVVSATSAPSASRTATSRKPQPFDRLTISLELHSDVVAPGGKIQSLVSVKNDSSRPVVDPGCALYAYRFALVPADRPDAELWGQVIVDCAGRLVMRPGYVNSFTGPTFTATDKFGDPLPVGEYLAVMELQRRSERFIRPVTVTE